MVYIIDTTQLKERYRALKPYTVETEIERERELFVVYFVFVDLSIFIERLSNTTRVYGIVYAFKRGRCLSYRNRNERNQHIHTHRQKQS